MSSREIIIFNPLNTVDQGVEMFIREYKIFLGFTVSIIIFQGTRARTLTQIGLDRIKLPPLFNTDAPASVFRENGQTSNVTFE